MIDNTGRKILGTLALALPLAMPCSALAQSFQAWANGSWSDGPDDHSQSDSTSFSSMAGTLDSVSASAGGPEASVHPSTRSPDLGSSFKLEDQALAPSPGRGHTDARTSYDFALNIPTDGYYRFTLDVHILIEGDNPEGRYFGDANANFSMAGVWSGSTDHDLDVSITKYLMAGSYEIKGGTSATSNGDITGSGSGQAWQEFTLAPVPEPASAGLLALGVGLLAVFTNRRRALESRAGRGKGLY